MNSYSGTHQHWSTSKNLHAFEFWVDIKCWFEDLPGLIGEDGKRESRESDFLF